MLRVQWHAGHSAACRVGFLTRPSQSLHAVDRIYRVHSQVSTLHGSAISKNSVRVPFCWNCSFTVLSSTLRPCTTHHNQRRGGTGPRQRVCSLSTGSPCIEPAAVPTTTSAEGQVVSAQANFMTVRVADGIRPEPVELLCVVRALLKKMRQRVLVGDQVRVISIDWIDRRGVVEDVLPRVSELQDPAVANVDQVLLVFSLAEPPWDGQVATRFLVSVEASDIPVTVILNKADLASHEVQTAITQQVNSWGYNSVLVSAASKLGLSELRSSLQLHTTVIAGPSGVGKSSLINALHLEELAHQSQRTPHAPDSDNLPTASCKPAESQATSIDVVAFTEPQNVFRDQEVQNSTDELDLYGGSSQSGMHSFSNEDSAAQIQAGSSMKTSQPEKCVPSSGQSSVQLEGSNIEAHPTEAQHGLERDDADATLLANSQGPLMSQLQAVGEVTSIGRGRHTTRHVAFLQVAGGLLADTPGFNQPALQHLDPVDLPSCFPEIRDSLHMCAFRNCQHLQEPRCGVRDGWARHAWYAELHAELTAADDLARHRSASKLRRQGTSRTKSRAGGEAGREVLLDPKSHRRVNRKQAKQQMQEMMLEDGTDEQ